MKYPPLILFLFMFSMPTISSAYNIDCTFTQLPTIDVKKNDDPNSDDPVGTFLKFYVGPVSANYTCVNGSPWNWLNSSIFYVHNIDKSNTFNEKLYDMIMTAYMLNIPVRIVAQVYEELEVGGYVGDSSIHTVQLLKP